MGMPAYDSKLFSAMTPNITQPIGCANCHEAGTMRLVITNPAVDAALKAQGIDWRTQTRQQMRSLVCANCHVTYFFAGDEQGADGPLGGRHARGRHHQGTRTA